MAKPSAKGSFAGKPEEFLGYLFVTQRHRSRQELVQIYREYLKGDDVALGVVIDRTLDGVGMLFDAQRQGR